MSLLLSLFVSLHSGTQTLYLWNRLSETHWSERVDWCRQSIGPILNPELFPSTVYFAEYKKDDGYGSERGCPLSNLVLRYASELFSLHLCSKIIIRVIGRSSSQIPVPFHSGRILLANKFPSNWVKFSQINQPQYVSMATHDISP